MKLLKMAGLSVLLVSAGPIVANAEYQVSPTYATPPQVAANPGIPYSYTQQPVPNAGPSNLIQPPSSAPTASATTGIRSEEGNFYSKKGFGPAPN